jgi:enoyl-CoA hydratase
MSLPIIVSVADDVLSITWNNPVRLNAFNGAMLDAAAEAIETATDDVRVIVLSGTGRAFSSGGDVTDLNIEMVDSGHRLVRAITRARQPVISGVNGPAVGMACSIAVAADLTLAKRSSYFLMAFVNLGVMPDGGSTELLAASIGRARANEMVMLGERLYADAAAQLGLIYKSVADNDYDDELRILWTGFGPVRRGHWRRRGARSRPRPSLISTRRLIANAQAKPGCLRPMTGGRACSPLWKSARRYSLGDDQKRMYLGVRRGKAARRVGRR